MKKILVLKNSMNKKLFNNEITNSIQQQQPLGQSTTTISAGKMLLANKIRDYLSVNIFFFKNKFFGLNFL